MPQKKRSKASVRSKRAGRGSAELENYQKALDGLERALRSLYKDEVEKAKEQLERLRDSFGSEQELMDRVQSYLVVCERKMAPPARPKSSEELVTQGVFELNGGNTQEAIKCFTKGLEQLPDDPYIRYCLGAAYARAGDAAEAAKHLRLAIQRDPTSRIHAKSDRDFASVLGSEEIAAALST
ncbi:MAG TPA: tetratricopeptide repeat protein [Vicinamibacteria bacterium]|nr:tetratricopeptide repeat protein [Vicinamibacteria bacterium]